MFFSVHDIVYYLLRITLILVLFVGGFGVSGKKTTYSGLFGGKDDLCHKQRNRLFNFFQLHTSSHIPSDTLWLFDLNIVSPLSNFFSYFTAIDQKPVSTQSHATTT